MRLTLYFLLSAGLVVIGYSQRITDYVRLSGQILSAKDSSFVPASLYYEKLPYYDDMGIGKTTEEGIFEFYLINDNTYKFKLSAASHSPLVEEITMSPTEEDGSMRVTWYLEPDEEPEVISLDNLIFARGSDVITESSYTELDNLVNFLNERAEITIQLEGHTDFAGNEDANMRLSQARVDAVKEYLVSKGVKKNRVLTKAFGGSQPLFTERTDEAKTKNRRVEVRVIR